MPRLGQSPLLGTRPIGSSLLKKEAMNASGHSNRFYDNFRDLSHFQQRNTTALLGRGFLNLIEHEGVSLRGIARSFGFTPESIRQTIQSYQSHRHLFDSPTLVPQELGACNTSVPSKRCEASNSPADPNGQTTVSGAFCVSKISDERSDR